LADISPTPLAGVIMASLADYEIVKPALDLFESWNLPYEIVVASALRTPKKVIEWAESAEARGVQVIVASGGGAAHLPGLVAAHTPLPVIGIPIETGALHGADALYSIVQSAAGIPIATVGINNAINAAALALAILARVNSAWGEVLKNYRAKMAERVERQNAELREERPNAVWPAGGKAPRKGTSDKTARTDRTDKTVGPVDEETRKERGDERRIGGIEEEREDWDEEEAEVRPVDFSKPLEPAPGAKTVSRPPKSALGPAPIEQPRARPSKIHRRARYIGRRNVDPDLLPVEIVEEAVDCLLDGGVIALPTDTVYGLAVDATNDEAVQRLFEIKGREPNRAIAVFIDNQRLLASLVKNMTVDIRRMLEAFWPGPLTVVFERRGEDFAHLSNEPTLGVRLPDHSIPLTLIQELCRPMACTSANPSGQPPATSGIQVEKYFGKAVDMILDAGPLPPGKPSTVVDVTQTPFRIMREGSITRDQMAAVVGDLIENKEED
jgi:5-(carboxyamino)imidazole ribonucleotide mutase